jgi:hypothetical protein
MHFSEEGAYRVIALAFMQQQEPGVSWRHVCCDKQVVEPVDCLQQQDMLNQLGCIQQLCKQV